MKGIFKSSIARSIMGRVRGWTWTSRRDDARTGARVCGVERVRATIYVARLPETLQEQFITDIRAIWRAGTLL